ncbi:Carbonic anhydrase [Mycena kentingensis (nom. inval.)]|nr:Carbonic anhydrase [Mycena kentingensis (nom. inval.)]
MPQHTEFAAKNAKYVASFGDKGSLPMPPGKKLIVLTCMDARLDPAAHLGLSEGDAHVIRNAGGMATRPTNRKDSLRSLIISQRLLGTREIAVFHHTDCGMLTFASADVRKIVKDAAPGDEQLAARVEGIDFLPFKDLEQSVREDVAYLKGEALILEGTEVTGWVYDVKTGSVKRVV